MLGISSSSRSSSVEVPCPGHLSPVAPAVLGGGDWQWRGIRPADARLQQPNGQEQSGGHLGERVHQGAQVPLAAAPAGPGPGALPGSTACTLQRGEAEHPNLLEHFILANISESLNLQNAYFSQLNFVII